MEVGRPPLFNEELRLKIRGLVLEGKKYYEIQEELAISKGTWDSWVWTDYQGFRADLITWKRERMFKRAEEKLEQFLDSDQEKIAQDTAKFLTERLGKEAYSTRQELTAKDGDALIPEQKAAIEQALDQVL